MAKSLKVGDKVKVIAGDLKGKVAEIKPVKQCLKTYKSALAT